MHYRKEIDGLRALAVIPVMLFHANVNLIPGGYIGVDIFFVISGYLITGIIINATEQKHFKISSFYERRARRILPALIIVILFSIFASIFIMYPFQIIDFAKSVFYVSIFSSNFYFWQNTGGYFGTLSGEMPLLHTWSLAVEEQFYLIFPIFFIIFLRFGYKKILILILVITILSFCIAQYASFHHPRPNFFLIFTRAWEILIGSICAIFLIKYGDKVKKSNLLSIIGLFLILISIFLFTEKTPFPSAYTLLPTIGTALIIIYSNSINLIGRFLSLKPLVFLGLISYSAYLWHHPFLAFASIYFDGELNEFLSIFICVVAFFFAYYSWKFVETPFRNKEIINLKHFLIALIFSLILIISYSLLAIKLNGFSNLWPTQDRSIVSMHPLKSAEYVVRRFNEHKNKNFSSNGKKNLLVIGDSYAQDFVNILYESNYNQRFNISTRHIKPRCGNLFINKKLIDTLNKYDTQRCFKEKYYDTSLKKLIKKADYIFLASSWEYDEIRYIPLSLENIKAITDAKVFVVGRKMFPNYKWTTKDLIDINYNSRPGIKKEVNNEHMKTHRHMKSSINKLNFINLHDLICEDTKCPIFDKDANLLSYDGSHFTKHGAQFIVNLMLNKGTFLKIFN
tara:strand:+ start:4099 stop:5970 length:1872 start_codon:yes stop_codon:yes gene_type:complete